ncbi:hypothetical protein [Leifsonia xyli]|nr:hypothetical protein [Leifsonia xyli]
MEGRSALDESLLTGESRPGAGGAGGRGVDLGQRVARRAGR